MFLRYNRIIFILIIERSDSGQASARTGLPQTPELLSSFIENNQMSNVMTTKEPHFETATRSDENEDAHQCSSCYCKHAATCVVEGYNYSCICTPDFIGTHCELGVSIILHAEIIFC